MSDPSSGYLGAPPDLPRSPLPETVAGRYVIGDRVGSGSFGTVYSATDQVTDERVAIKLIPRDAGRDRLRRETVALRGLRLPGVVALRDEGVDGAWLFVVMEFVDGRPFPGPTPPLSWRELSTPAREFFRILGRVHAVGGLHLDLKPENVVVGDHGQVTLLDFGLAAGQALGGAVSDQAIGGTLRYMAPEQLAGATVDARSDLYAVGLMLYEAMTGALPHAGSARVRIHKDPIPIGTRAPELPAAIAAEIDALLAREPAHRPRSAWEVLERLERDLPTWQPALPDGQDPIPENQLAALFHGPVRLFHLPDEAARILVERTHGHRERVRDELGRWIRAGIVLPDGDRLRVYPFMSQRDAGRASATPHHAGGAYGKSLSALVDQLLPDSREATTSRRSERVANDVAILIEVARGHHEEGRTRLAYGALEHGLLLTRRGIVSQSDESGLLSVWAQLALAERTRQALDLALYQVDRALASTPAIEAMGRLLRTALHAVGGEVERARSEIDGLEPFDDPGLELQRHSWRVYLAAKSGTERVARTVDEILPWAAKQQDPDIAARALSWVGRVHYQQGNFARAAALQEQAAGRARSRMLQLSCRLNAASAWIEIAGYDHARDLAERGLIDARVGRHTHFEARAEWLSRAVDYRRGVALRPDHELVEASCFLDLPYLEGLICLNEAAVAWRNGDRHSALSLADRARMRFDAATLRAGALLAQALVLVCRSGSRQAIDELAMETLRKPIPDIDWQIMALLSSLPSGRRWRDDASRLIVAAADPERRRDVLAPIDAMESALWA